MITCTVRSAPGDTPSVDERVGTIEIAYASLTARFCSISKEQNSSSQRCLTYHVSALERDTGRLNSFISSYPKRYRGNRHRIHLPHMLAFAHEQTIPRPLCYCMSLPDSSVEVDCFSVRS